MSQTYFEKEGLADSKGLLVKQQCWVEGRVAGSEADNLFD